MIWINAIAAWGVELPVTTIRKRDGRLVPFTAAKITDAIAKAGAATGEFSRDEAQRLTRRVLAVAAAALEESQLTVEAIQDAVESVLLATPYLCLVLVFFLFFV